MKEILSSPILFQNRGAKSRSVFLEKPSLRLLYREIYLRFDEVVNRCPPVGRVIELGSGNGFIKDVVPEAITSDIMPAAGVERILDGTSLNLPDNSVKAFFLLNVLHHVRDSKKLFAEIDRCLVPGGRCLIVDQYPGIFSQLIFRYLHNEGYDEKVKEWTFPKTGPLRNSNGALAWIIFYRDSNTLSRLVPNLQLVKKIPHTPLRYWLAGGLKEWSLLPEFCFGMASFLDRQLATASSSFCSFLDVELVKKNQRITSLQKALPATE